MDGTAGKVAYFAILIGMVDADLPEQAIEAFEQMHDLCVSVHVQDRAMWAFLSALRMIHRHPFCGSVKVAEESRCVTMDVDRVGAALSARRDGFAKRCHAGVLEWVVPVWRGEQRVMTLFAGVRRLAPGVSPDQLTGALVERMPGPRSAGSHAAHLDQIPQVSLEQVPRLLELTRQLAARLTLWVQEAADLLHAESGASAGRLPHVKGRRDLIRWFVLRRHREPVTLEDLAQVLELSPGRTAHLVREVCGSTLVEMLIEARLRTAAGLLRHTDLPVSEVAMRSGFGDLSHFHRCFRQKLFQTPLAYRRQTREAAAALTLEGQGLEHPLSAVAKTSLRLKSS